MLDVKVNSYIYKTISGREVQSTKLHIYWNVDLITKNTKCIQTYTAKIGVL